MIYSVYVRIGWSNCVREWVRAVGYIDKTIKPKSQRRLEFGKKPNDDMYFDASTQTWV